MGDMLPDIEELTHCADSCESKALKGRLKNPLTLRLPLWNPDRFLNVTMPLVRPLFSHLGAIIWVVVVASAIVLAVLNWTALTSG